MYNIILYYIILYKSKIYIFPIKIRSLENIKYRNVVI